MSAHEPPRLATWLVDVLAPRDRREQILGDLHEEFLQRSHSPDARRWYRRQSLRTAAHLAIEPFRSRPLSTLALAYVGWILVIYVGVAFSFVATRIVLAAPGYQYVTASLFWRAVDLVPWVAGGWILGRMASDRPVQVAMTTSAILYLALYLRAARPVVAVVLDPGRSYHRYLAPPIMEMLRNPGTFAALVIAGAMLSRTLRRREPSTAP